MSDTISWNLRLSIQNGRLADARKLMNEMVAATLEKEQDTLIYEWFINAEGTACHIYERYLNSEAVMVHMANFGGHFADRFLSCFELTSVTVYGNPSSEVREALDQFGASYLEVFGGFARS